ncbi:MAG: hypothetical protein D6690_07460 [Nitrospirae bacterium]|nr:MAG: hypothetical protein D6690_07460 [Nitrospirota bacterium]
MKSIPANRVAVAARPECPRCQGHLVLTRLQFDGFASAASSWPVSWRCVNCGAVVDDHILHNRLQAKLSNRATRVVDPASRSAK